MHVTELIFASTMAIPVYLVLSVRCSCIVNIQTARECCLVCLTGKASLGKVCDPDNSCAIAEALGFVTPFVIAHEIGHTYVVRAIHI